ncbi:MAG TPA: hypothetical protein VF940_14390 [Streptosporangiaceae bacterium]
MIRVGQHPAQHRHGSVLHPPSAIVAHPHHDLVDFAGRRDRYAGELRVRRDARRDPSD